MAFIVITDDGHHMWQGATAGGPEGDPYGVFTPSADEGQQYAHRWIYEQKVGPIPDDHVIDHLCRIHLCENHEHLEPVTYSVNITRGLLPDILRAKFSAITHCPQGHEYTPENTYLQKGNKRNCRACTKLAGYAYDAKNREERARKAREYRARKKIL